MIYILEGPDGVGKTTLAREIYDQTKGHVLHCTWKSGWNMKEYFTEVLRIAKMLNKYQDVIIDRWAPSEWVYGHVFRGGPQFDVFDYIWEQDLQDVKFIMCQNDNAVLNHLKNKTEREEMFDDITDVVSNYMLFKNDSSDVVDWIDYNYDKVDMQQFVKELLSENVSD